MMNKKPYKLVNYHSHTVYCFHAFNTAEEMILKAIKEGYELIGFSEHAPLGVHRKFRLNFDTLEEYLNEMKVLKQKYKKQIKVLIGLECEYHQCRYDFYKAFYDNPDIDYLIFGNHNIGDPFKSVVWNQYTCDFNKYYEQAQMACESKLFSCFAHPDIIYRYYSKQWDKSCEQLAKKIIDLSIKYDIPLGFNLNGLSIKQNSMQYPADNFWSMVAKSKAKVIIENDAHEISTLNKELFDRGYQLIKKWKLDKNLVFKLKTKHD